MTEIRFEKTDDDKVKMFLFRCEILLEKSEVVAMLHRLQEVLAEEDYDLR